MISVELNRDISNIFEEQEVKTKLLSFQDNAWSHLIKLFRYTKNNIKYGNIAQYR